jgi:hypothetical protein
MNWLADILEKCWSGLGAPFKSAFFKKASGVDGPNDSQWLFDQQIIALIFLSGGTAFDFYRSGIPISEKLMILSGQYWRVPADDKLDPGDDDES